MTKLSKIMSPPRFCSIHRLGRIDEMALAKVLFNKQNHLLRRKYSLTMGMGKISEDRRRGGMLSAVEHDVCLNFRGPDTRQGFVDCLYHVLSDANIRVFFDEKKLQIGKEIGEGLQIAIERSKIYVPIFSKGYASSPWCLRELEHMVECRKFKPSEKEILPIFYDVEPRDVELQSQLYVDALAKHEEKFGCQAIRSWESALKSVAQIKGWELKNQGHWKFIKLVTEEILRKLKVQDKYVERQGET